MKNVTLDIETGNEEGKRTVSGRYDDNSEKIIFIWKQEVEGEEFPPEYKVTYNKKTKRAEMRRSGSISIELTFDTEEETSGKMNTPYGIIPVGVVTDYINPPSVLSNKLEISYALKTNGEVSLKNIISINFHLHY